MTTLNLEEIKNHLVKTIESINNNEWTTFELVINFPPFSNKGFNTKPSFWGINGNRLIIFPTFSDEFKMSFFDFIRQVNQNCNYNQLVFAGEKSMLKSAIINVNFNQDVEDNFQNNLPKSKRGKTTPWWKME